MSANPSDFGPMPEPEDSTGPGSQLREARHEAKTSLEEVAARLHLDRGMVRALEENDFDKLPAATFVRGYIRSYARLLDLPPGPILEAFDHQGLAPPAIIADITQHPQAKSSDVPVRLATYLVAAGLVLMVIMWWSSRENVFPAVPSIEVAANTPLQADAPPEVAIVTADDLHAPESITLSGPSDAFTPNEDPPAEPASAMTAMPAPSDEAAMSQTDTPAADADTPTTVTALVSAPAFETAVASESATALDTAPALEDSDEAAGTTEQAPVSADAASADSSSGRFDLRFANDSWVEVYDGSGDRLVFRLVRAGGSINLSAAPPIRVVLGFADGAELTLNDQPIDLAPFKRRGLARFIIGTDWIAESAWASASSASRSAVAEPEAPATGPESPTVTVSESSSSAGFEVSPAADSEAAASVQVEAPAAAQFEVPAVAEDADDVLPRR
jgi:cytoskeleton protein RodZ